MNVLGYYASHSDLEFFVLPFFSKNFLRRFTVTLVLHPFRLSLNFPKIHTVLNQKTKVGKDVYLLIDTVSKHINRLFNLRLTS